MYTSVRAMELCQLVQSNVVMVWAVPPKPGRHLH